MVFAGIPVGARSGAVAPTADKEAKMNHWKYKIDVSQLSVFDELEKQYGIQFPAELRDFITEHNAATPEKYHFMVANTEKIFGAVLSVNKGEPDTDTIYTALSCVKDPTYIPFAIDPFGNYICYSSEDGAIVFWDHEANRVFSSEKKMNEFINSLY